MKKSTQGMELSVAILMDDLASAKEISDAIRNLGIFSHHYQSLDEFWATTSIELPDLLFLDVTKMSQGNILFKNHSRVLDGSLSYVIFSKDSTKVLLQSTLSMKPYAYLHKDVTLSSQVEGIVLKKQNDLKNQKELTEFESRIQRLQARSQRMILERSQAEEFKAQFEFIKSFCIDVEKSLKGQNFINSLATKLETWNVINSFGMYELSQDGQKLVSQLVSSKKYHPFPSLWLGQANLNGIEKFAQDMALQVSLDLFETNPQMIRISGGNTNPDMLLFLELNQEGAHSISWDLFEFMINSSFRQIKISTESAKFHSPILSTWEGLDYLDKLSSANSSEQETRVIAINMLPVCELVKKRVNNKFYWTSFYNELLNQLTDLLQKKSKISMMGPWNVLVYVQKENLEMEYNVLQMILKSIQLWRYFEDDSQILKEEVYPSLRLIPLSSANYLRAFSSDFENAINYVADDLKLRKGSSNPRLQI